ncbi:unnamed protein product [Blepharisma stoltei]|uniref:Malate dehydrogenase n=1 Tax=Blepharisma stoltei TaxID=1481888 RepID=A0AAU9IC34_9CILI|nr:unnamed protein product [Blepharisma stoltei]
MASPSKRFRTIEHHLRLKDPMVVCVTGAAGQIAYSLLPMLGRGLALGTDQLIDLRLLEIPQAQGALEGVVMELQDCAYPLFYKISYGSDPAVLFKDADLIIFLGGFPRKAGMERKELIGKNCQIFKTQGEALNLVGKPTTKCLVVANPANTNCLALSTFASRIPKENFTALTRLDQNRAVWQIAARAKMNVAHISRVIIWGNHSSTQYPDVNHGQIATKVDETITSKPIREKIADNNWLNGKFIADVQQRGAAVIKARKLSSAMSAASAAIDHVRDWCLGTNGRWVSMGVVSDGAYGVPPGLVFSYPVVCENWTWTIIRDLTLDQFSQEKICATARELVEERRDALS